MAKKGRLGDRKLDLLDLAKSQGVSRQAIELTERIKAAESESPPDAPKEPGTSDLLDEALRRQIWNPAGPKPEGKKRAGPVKKAWGNHLLQSDVNAAMGEVAKGYPSAEKYLPETPRPAFSEILAKLRAIYGQELTERQAKAALKSRASHLKGRPGIRSAPKSPA
jgi:hypothetical protein